MEDSRWMIEAFSNASEVWVVSLVVNASFLRACKRLRSKLQPYFPLAPLRRVRSPRKRDLDLSEPQLEQLELPEILVEQVPR